MQADKQALRDLRDRVTNATGPDRELDALLMTHLTPDDLNGPAFWQWRGLQPRSLTDQALAVVRAKYALERAPTYTASVDAALALIERVLPGKSWAASTSLGGRYAVAVSGAGKAVDGPTFALALLAALLGDDDDA